MEKEEKREKTFFLFLMGSFLEKKNIFLDFISLCTRWWTFIDVGGNAGGADDVGDRTAGENTGHASMPLNSSQEPSSK